MTQATVTVPLEPSDKLLSSMATRMRHDFGLLDEATQRVILSDMRKVYEEVVGTDFYRAAPSPAVAEPIGHQWRRRFPDPKGKTVDALGCWQWVYGPEELEKLRTMENIELRPVYLGATQDEAKDADRYRWLREHSTQPVEPWSTHSNPESLDKAIDAAMAADKET